jgi:hypothetical protein
MSKSLKRRRGIARVTWLNAAEDAELEAKRKAVGVSRAELIRMALFNYKPPRNEKAELELLAHILAELGGLKGLFGKYGSNLNQLSHYSNMDRFMANLIQAALEENGAALRALHECRGAIMRYTDSERHRKPTDE